MDGKLIYIYYIYISFASGFLFFTSTLTQQHVYTHSHTISHLVYVSFFLIYIYRLAMWAASGLILQGCTNHMGGVEAITQSLNDNMFYRNSNNNNNNKKSSS